MEAVDNLHKFFSNDVSRFLGINVNSDLISQTHPCSTSACTHETKEGLDALLVHAASNLNKSWIPKRNWVCFYQGATSRSSKHSHSRNKMVAPPTNPFLLHHWGQSWICYFNNTVTNSFCYMMLSVHVLCMHTELHQANVFFCCSNNSGQNFCSES